MRTRTSLDTSTRQSSSDGQDKAHIITADELPDDPLSMPPPYWRSSGAIFHVLVALDALVGQLPLLPPLIARTDRKLGGYFKKFPEPTDSKEAMDEFGGICETLWELEHSIELNAERAILMSAIASEDDVNHFCVFNLRRDVAETIEKLSLPEKLIVASGALGKHGVKRTVVYEKAKKLILWRNAFAHGHCVDRPLKSLRHNHLIHPDEYPGVPGAIHDVIELVGAFLAISRYLKSVSVNASTALDSYENGHVEKCLKKIGNFVFEGNEMIYTVRKNRGSQRRKKGHPAK